MGNLRINFPVADLENVGVTANNDWFGSDIVPDISADLSTTFTVHLALSASAIIRYTVDGTNFVSINNGDVATAESGHVFQVTLRSGDAFNIQSSENGTVRFCRIDIV